VFFIKFRINDSIEKLSSGYRINKAADDAAGLAISEKMRMEINGLDQSERNIQDAISLIQTAEAGHQELHSILHRMRSLSIQAANDTLVNEDRRFIQYEVDQLLCEIDRMQTTVVFNTRQLLTGQYTLGGSPGSLIFHVGGQTNQTYTVNNISSYSTAGLRINTMATGQNAALTSRAGAESAIALLTTAINSISEMRAKLGATQNRLTHNHNFVLIAKENQQAAEGRIRDVDMAGEMITYTKNQILLNTAQAMLTQANLRPQTVLQMFQ